jgi:RecA/RadA recombinase
MIIEFFGPAAAGKTTFAHALCKRLNERGHHANVVLSYPRVRQPALPIQEKPKPLAALHYNGLYAKSAGNALIYQTKAPLVCTSGPHRI